MHFWHLRKRVTRMHKDMSKYMCIYMCTMQTHILHIRCNASEMQAATARTCAYASKSINTLATPCGDTQQASIKSTQVYYKPFFSCEMMKSCLWVIFCKDMTAARLLFRLTHSFCYNNSVPADGDHNCCKHLFLLKYIMWH